MEIDQDSIFSVFSVFSFGTHVVVEVRGVEVNSQENNIF